MRQEKYSITVFLIFATARPALGLDCEYTVHAAECHHRIPAEASQVVPSMVSKGEFVAETTLRLDVQFFPSTDDKKSITVTCANYQSGDLRTKNANPDEVNRRTDSCQLQDMDTDGDGVLDVEDNCITVENPLQRDSNADGHGNLCDGDFNNDCITNAIDLGIMRTQYFFPGDLDTDMNGDGVVGVIDLGRLKAVFFEAPGPSANGACDPD